MLVCLRAVQPRRPAGPQSQSRRQGQCAGHLDREGATGEVRCSTTAVVGNSSLTTACSPSCRADRLAPRTSLTSPRVCCDRRLGSVFRGSGRLELGRPQRVLGLGEGLRPGGEPGSVQGDGRIHRNRLPRHGRCARNAVLLAAARRPPLAAARSPCTPALRGSLFGVAYLPSSDLP
jgi:hypothetical protein